MQKKALVLGAHPPFEGPWVSLGGAEKWEVNVVGGKLEDVTFELKKGDGCKDFCANGKTSRAEAVKAHLRPSGYSGSVTVYIESVEA